MWSTIIANFERSKHEQNALLELEKALYQAKLDYLTGNNDVERINLAIEILKGNI
jgi:hypothetical protein